MSLVSTRGRIGLFEMAAVATIIACALALLTYLGFDASKSRKEKSSKPVARPRLVNSIPAPNSKSGLSPATRESSTGSLATSSDDTPYKVSHDEPLMSGVQTAPPYQSHVQRSQAIVSASDTYNLEAHTASPPETRRIETMKSSRGSECQSTSGSDTAVTVSDKIEGNTTISKRTDLRGMIAGSVTVTEGITFEIHGMVTGDVILQKDSSCYIWSLNSCLGNLLMYPLGGILCTRLPST